MARSWQLIPPRAWSLAVSDIFGQVDGVDAWTAFFGDAVCCCKPKLVEQPNVCCIRRPGSGSDTLTELLSRCQKVFIHALGDAISTERRTHNDRGDIVVRNRGGRVG